MSDFLRPRVLIYRNDLLERSETFITAQTGALRRFTPVYCGLRRRANGFLPSDVKVAVLGDEEGSAARLRRLAYLQTGFAPQWRRTMAAQGATLMHAHFALDAACALPLLDRLGIPLVVTLHGYDVTTAEDALGQSRGGRLYLRRQQDLFTRTHTFVCISEFIRDHALAAGFPAHKLWVHSIGVDLETFGLDEFPDGDTCGPLVLFVGRLVEKKGCIHLLQAMRIVQEWHDRARLVVIGDGVLRPVLERTARELALRDCRFLGAQPASVIRNWLRRARVFSVPSITAANGDAEGLGMVFCEAQAMGVPVVSFATGGISEAVADGQSGFLVREKDETALAERILLLLEDEAVWNEMRLHGRRRMVKLFDLKKQTALLEAKYDEVLMRSRKEDLLLH